MKSLDPVPASLRLWLPVVLYAALIYFVSSQSFRLSWFQNTQKNHSDWLVHVVEYSILGVLLCRALGALDIFKGSVARLWMAVVLCGTLYGISDEFHQSFIPDRDASLYDIIADAVGVALGCWVWIKKKRKENA